jgi:hypothetical protein
MAALGWCRRWEPGSSIPAAAICLQEEEGLPISIALISSRFARR